MLQRTSGLADWSTAQPGSDFPQSAHCEAQTEIAVSS